MIRDRYGASLKCSIELNPSLVVLRAGREVALPVAAHGDDPGLVEGGPHLDLVAELAEAHPGVLLEPRHAVGVQPSSLLLDIRWFRGNPSMRSAKRLEFWASPLSIHLWIEFTS